MLHVLQIIAIIMTAFLSMWHLHAFTDICACFAGPMVEEEEIDGESFSTGDTGENFKQSGSCSPISEDVRQAQITEAAELLRCLGDQIQAEFGDQIDNIVRQIDWTLPRPEVLADLEGSTAELIQRVNNDLTRVSIGFTGSSFT
jgi:hypothetical protein